MLARLTSPFRRFADDTRGNMVMELLLVMPFFIWAILGTMVYFYGFHLKSINLKGAYTISDLLSREMDKKASDDYIQGLDGVFNFLTNTPDNMGRIRVTMVYCNDDCDPDTATGPRELKIDWSRGTDGLQDMTEDDLASEYDDQIPLIPKDERIIIVETQVLYRPPVWFGVYPETMNTLVATRLRFAPKLEWDNGTG